MRWLLNYLRQMFCIHEWEYDEAHVTFGENKEKEGTRVFARCKKCGYHETYWKYI